MSSGAEQRGETGGRPARQASTQPKTEGDPKRRKTPAWFNMLVPDITSSMPTYVIRPGCYFPHPAQPLSQLPASNFLASEILLVGLFFCSHLDMFTVGRVPVLG
jgi:hypothetical protein